jgi:hypothetical protein
MKFSRVLLALWLAAARAEIQFGQDSAANDVATRVADGVSPLKPASLQLPDGDPLKAVAALLAFQPLPSSKLALNGPRRDCFVTRITVHRREASAKQQTYFAYWDDVSVSQAPSDLVRLAAAVVALANK